MKSSKLERAGERFLTSPAYVPPRTASYVVRIYYTSMGGEILAVDSALLSPAGRDALVRELRGGDALGYCEIKMAHGREVSRYSRVDEPTRRHARLVVMSSQATDAIMTCEVSSEAA